MGVEALTDLGGRLRTLGNRGIRPAARRAKLDVISDDAHWRMESAIRRLPRTSRPMLASC